MHDERWAEQCAAVNAWLNSIYGEGRAPPFELNRETVGALYRLAQRYRVGQQVTSAQIADLVEYRTECEMLATSLESELEEIGMHPNDLSLSGRASLDTLVSVAETLNLRRPRSASYISAVHDMVVTHDALQDELETEEDIAAQLLSEHREAVLRLQRLQPLKLDDTERRDKERLIEQKEDNLKYLHGKFEQYSAKLEGYQQQLKDSGFHHDISHAALLKLRDEVVELQKQAAPVLAKLRSYNELPADFSLARLRMQELQQELEQVDEKLAQSLTSSVV